MSFVEFFSLRRAASARLPIANSIPTGEAYNDNHQQFDEAAHLDKATDQQSRFQNTPFPGGTHAAWPQGAIFVRLICRRSSAVVYVTLARDWVSRRRLQIVTQLLV